MHPKADIVYQTGHVRKVPTPEVAGLFDDLLGLGEQRRGHRKAERLGGSEVDE
jgi:hypothetical protein